MPDLDPTNDRLAQGASAGNNQAVEVLLARYLPGLHAYVRLRAGQALRNKESVADLVQSVCRELLQDVERIQHGGEQGFKKWLYAAALRKILHRAAYYRAERRDVGREVAMPADDESGAAARLLTCYRSFCTPSRIVADREQIELVERAFEQLSEDHREVITQAYLLGLSHKEIGEHLGRSEGAVRKLLARALAHLCELVR